MIRLNAIPMDYEPRHKIMLKLSAHGSGLHNLILMDEPESAFLCGALKTFRPKKILEVGVAAGGSTAIILQALEDIGAPYEMHSVDLRKKHEVYDTEDIGFLAIFAKEKNLINPDGLRGTHEFHVGKYLPQVIDEIGSDIDFVIFDTVHFLPGEVLDFPVMLPYLKNGAVVVLHDVALNQYKRQSNWGTACATGALFGAVTAEKFLDFMPDSAAGNVRSAYPNIGAFKVSEQTREHIENVFLLNTLNWHYAPDSAQIKIYREFYGKHYTDDLIRIFDETALMNLYNFLIAEYN